MKRVVGLDIGSFMIKGVEIQYDSAKMPRITNFGMVSLPVGAVSNDRIVDSAQVVDSIKKLWSQANFKSKEVSVGVSGSRVVLRDVEVPQMSDEDILSSLRIEASQFLPGDLDEYEVDFERPLEGVRHELQEMDSVHLVACDTGILREFEAVVVDAGLKLQAVDTSFFALFRSVSKFGMGSTSMLSQTVSNSTTSQVPDSYPSVPEDSRSLDRNLVPSEGQNLPSAEIEFSSTESIPVVPNEVLAIVVVGADNVTIGVAENGMVTLARTIDNRGGDMITSAIADAFGVDENRAEILKRQAGSPINAEFEFEPNVDQRSLDSLVSTRSGEIADSISSTLNSYLFQKEDVTTVHLLITGGGVVSFGLFEALRRSLAPEIVISRLDLFDQFSIEHLNLPPAEVDRVRAVMQQALALALGRWIASPGVRVVNLLGTDAEDRRRFVKDIMLSGAGVVVVIGALGGLYLLRSNDLSSINQQVTAAQGQLANDQAQLARLSNVANIQTQLTSEEGQVQLVLANDVSWPIVVTEFDNAAPTDVWWTSFTGADAQGGQPAGVTIGAMGCSQHAPAHWIDGVGSIPGVLDPWVSSSTASSSILCANAPTSSAPNDTVVTFNSTASLQNSPTPNRYSSYLTGEGISQ